MENIIQYNGLKMLAGPSTHPGDGPVEYHLNEHKIFLNVLDKINNKNAVMIEVGCLWALWSLLFRQRFPQGKNILVELGRRQLSVGEKNFQLNGWSFSSYWGGFNIQNSGTFKNQEADINYPRNPYGYWDESITGNLVGKELNFSDIVQQENLDCIDLIHMDIQGSELGLLEYFEKNKVFDMINNIVVATHSVIIHNSVEKILQQNGFEIYESYPFGLVGGDGYFCATKKENKL